MRGCRANSFLQTGGGDITVLIPSNISVTLAGDQHAVAPVRSSAIFRCRLSTRGAVLTAEGRDQRRRTGSADRGKRRHDIHQEADRRCFEQILWQHSDGADSGELSVPLLCAQSQAPKARSASVFTGSRSYLGIGVVDMTDERAKALGLKEPQGVEVTSVSEDSPASKAGIKTGGRDSGV